MKLIVGNSAPDFKAKDQGGVERSLEDYKGKYLLLYFYPKDSTSGCTKEACGFRDVFIDLRIYTEILGVSGDSEKSHKGFVDKYSLPFPLLADKEKKIIEAYGADGMFFPKRVSFLINPEGIIVKIYEKVNPNGHAEEVLADLEKL